MGPIVTLHKSTKDTTKYGYRYGTNQHYGGLHLRFYSQQDDVNCLSLKRWDIDDPDEIKVRLNERRLGYLSADDSSNYNIGNKFCFDPNRFLKDGWNYIHLSSPELLLPFKTVNVIKVGINCG
jgi:hypothetical protein